MDYKSRLKGRLINRGRELGFSIVRVTEPKPFELWSKGIQKRKELDPDTANTWDRRGMSADPKAFLPEVRSLVVAAYPYKPYPLEFQKGFGSYSAHYRVYPRSRKAAGELSKILAEEGYKAVVDPPLPAKAAALRAGVGYFGKNGLIHTEEHGSWITLHMILTDAPLPYDPPGDKLSDCGSCTACIKSCPTGAIAEDGIIIPSRCIRFHMGSSELIPVDIRDKIGPRILGCDGCQISCPRNIKSYKEAAVPPFEEIEPFDIRAILTEWKSGLKKRLERVGSLVGQNYARAQKILSMAVLAAGNSNDKSFIPLLKETLQHPHPPIRGHSAWALGKLGGEESKRILLHALEGEKDPEIKKEIQNALKCI